jgi:hypothetical protein
MTLGILRKNSPILTLLWLQIPPLARVALVAESGGDVGEITAKRLATVASWYQERTRVS